MTPSAERLAIKESIRERDGHKCTDCGLTQKENSERINKAKRDRRLRLCLKYGMEFLEPNFLRTHQLHVHRIIPDGPYCPENCKTLCPSCHSKRRRDYTGEIPKWKVKALREIRKALHQRGDHKTANRLDIGLLLARGEARRQPA